MDKTTFTFQAIGTGWTLDIYDELSKENGEDLLGQIMACVDIFDKAYSRFREDSLVTRMSKESGDFTLPEDADTMISLYKKIYDATGGLVTPLIGQVLVDAGYDAQYSLKQKPLTKPLSWDEVMVWEYPTLTLKSPALLDFGAGGKGYLVDIVTEILEKNAIVSYCVDASGDMRQRNTQGKTLRVGLEHPEDALSLIHI
jgi:thiamine biosynthesis lipoprotein